MSQSFDFLPAGADILGDISSLSAKARPLKLLVPPKTARACQGECVVKGGDKYLISVTARFANLGLPSLALTDGMAQLQKVPRKATVSAKRP